MAKRDLTGRHRHPANYPVWDRKYWQGVLITPEPTDRFWRRLLGLRREVPPEETPGRDKTE